MLKELAAALAASRQAVTAIQRGVTNFFFSVFVCTKNTLLSFCVLHIL